MNVGVPREIKPGEQRLALTPAGALALIDAGHSVVVERAAGAGSGLADSDYAAVGAKVGSADDAWAAELVLKVKEPIAEEYRRFRRGLILFTYLHLAADRDLAEALEASGATAIGYETVQRADGALPLLTPMSEVAGRLAVQEGVYYLGKARGGRGILLAGVPGVPPGNVVIIGAGTAGLNAARMAVGLGADVSILDINLDRLRAVDELFQGRVVTLASNSFNVAQVAVRADLLIGAVLVPGARAPRLVSERLVADMKDGAVIVDVAVDQGGCIETIHATTLLDPVYMVHDVVHYGVANMPALVPRTSTFALTNATLPYVLQLAAKGAERAVRDSAELARGVNHWEGTLVHPVVAQAFGRTVASAWPGAAAHASRQ